MAVDRTAIVDRNVLELLERWSAAQVPLGDRGAPVSTSTSLVGRVFLDLLESQFVSRHLDFAARILKRDQTSFYTIGSSGHEGNAVLGRLLRADDPTFLHYRSGALMMERSRHAPGETPIFDTLLGIVASSEDPISRGRHKVWGSKRLWVPPQTSTIASHLPKALGAAFALDRARGLDLPEGWTDVPEDAVVACTFGDASVNHATAQAAFNSAAWTAFQKLPVPVLFVCEDNNIGISVRTPGNWVSARFRSMPDIAYFRGDGTDLVSAWNAAEAAIRHVREKRAPAFLHLETVRLLGHAGSDVETTYRDREEIEANERRDPLLRSIELALRAGLAGASDLRALYEATRDRVMAAARETVSRAKIDNAAEVIRPLGVLDAQGVRTEAERKPDPAARKVMLGGQGAPEESSRGRHLAVQLNRALSDALATYPEMILFGEDVGKKGGVYHVTTGLTERAGVRRVFNTLLDETTILGTAIGAGQIGLLPVPEIQYLAYYHNAEDQLRGEACSLGFFSDRQFANPMVVRIAAWAYQKGFGGHFHNDHSIAALRDVPGIVIASPSRPDDAVRTFRTCLALAKVEGKVVVFLEPIALYMTKDLHQPKDGKWETPYPAPGEAAPFGKAEVLLSEEGDALTVLSWANGLWLSMRAAERLRQQTGETVRIVDLRWLAPLDRETIVSSSLATGRALVVDEGRRTAGVGEEIVTAIVEGAGAHPPVIRRIAAEDTYIPLGPAADTVLPSEDSILAGMRELLEVPAQRSPKA